MKMGMTPMLTMLQPSASRPPSAKKRACTARMEAITMRAAFLPKRIARSSAPTRCPLEPVPGMAKFSIWAAKTKAPATPISGILLSSSSFRTLRAL
jgi:hypothetical protein